MILLDMEMPKSCKDCDLLNVVGNCSVTWKDVTNEADDEVIAESCPIKAEIPRNATNGDLLLSIFQEKSDCFYPIGTDKMGFAVDVEWWNAPWKGQENAEQESE